MEAVNAEREGRERRWVTDCGVEAIKPDEPNNNNPMKYTNAHESEIVTPQAPVRSGGVGSVPRRFVEQVEAATSANIVEFASLPKVRERCPISGASRSWLIETNAWLPRHQQFLVRVRRSGCLRGKVFVSVPKLSAFIRDVQSGEVEGFTKE